MLAMPYSLRLALGDHQRARLLRSRQKTIASPCTLGCVGSQRGVGVRRDRARGRCIPLKRVLHELRFG